MVEIRWKKPYARIDLGWDGKRYTDSEEVFSDDDLADALIDYDHPIMKLRVVRYKDFPEQIFPSLGEMDNAEMETATEPSPPVQEKNSRYAIFTKKSRDSSAPKWSYEEPGDRVSPLDYKKTYEALLEPDTSIIDLLDEHYARTGDDEHPLFSGDVIVIRDENHARAFFVVDYRFVEEISHFAPILDVRQENRPVRHSTIQHDER